MKTKLLIAMLVICQITTFGEPITKDQARQKAKAFLTSSPTRGMRKNMSTGIASRLTAIMETPFYYVFNVGINNGYVIVSGSDRTQAILGYTDTGTIDVKNIPIPMKEWLDELSTAVAAMENRESSDMKKVSHPKASSCKSITKNVIPVLVQSRWNQSDPYNLDCPKYHNKKNQSGICATGCVATAMAQIIGYWRWPVTTVPKIPEYTFTSEDSTYTLKALPPTTFNWEYITNTYHNNSSTESKQAIAQLMRYIGQSVKMSYGASSGAGVGNIVPAFINYFGYDPTLHFESHDGYSYQEWEDLIYSELAAGRPIMMNATTSNGGGGHEFVLDGYDGNGFYHVNWGWGGLDDGYFLLTVMSPGEQGIGGSSSADGYSMGQGIVVGIKPKENGAVLPEEIPHTSILNLKLDKTTYTRNSTKAYFSIKLIYGTGTSMREAYNFDHTFTLYDATGNLIKESLGIDANFHLSPGTWWPTRWITAILPRNIAKGRYYIKGRSRRHGTTTWIEDDNFNKNYFIVDVKSDTELSIMISPELNITVNSLELIGNGRAGIEQKVKVNITNHVDEYYEEMYLLEDGVWKSGNNVVLPAGKTTDIYFKYKPTTVGEHTLALSTSKEKKDIFYSCKKTILEAAKGNLSLVMTPLSHVDHSTNPSSIYGTQMTMQVKVINKDSNPYIGNIRVAPWELSGIYYWMRTSESQFINLEAGKDTTLVYIIKNLNTGSRYFFSGNSDNNDNARCGDFDVKTGIQYWTADGTQYGVKNQDGFIVTKDIAAIDIPSTTSPATIYINDEYNKNLIVYYEKNATVSSRVLAILKKKVNNIVFGGEAEKFVLNDAYNLYIPKSFTTKQASYIHKVEKVDINNNWSTIALPFAPQTVDADGETIDWFHRATDKDKGLILKEFTSVKGNHVYFNFVDKAAANRPYMVSYAGSMNGTVFNQSGKTLTYSATNTLIEAAERISTYSTDYKYMGTTMANTLTNVYMLDANGQRFIATDKTIIAPFSAYFVANNLEAATTKELVVVDENTATGIADIRSDEQNKKMNLYTINGIKIATATEKNISTVLKSLPKGIYIFNGKKYTK